MNTTNVQLTETVVNAGIAKVNEIRVSLREPGFTLASNSIRWKAKTATTFTVRVVTTSGQSTSSVSLSANAWSSVTFASQDCEIFVSPKANISEFQLFDNVSEFVTIDWGTFIYSAITKLVTYKSPIDVTMLPRLSYITQWNSSNSPQEIDFDSFLQMSSLTNLNIHYSKVFGNTTKISLLNNLTVITMGGTTNMNCSLSDFAQCTGLQSLTCSDSQGVSGTIEDLTPLAASLTTLQLNNSRNVTGVLASLRLLHLVTTCSLGFTGVSGKLSDLNGMKQSDTLTLRASAYMTNDINSVALSNNSFYTITFNSSGNVSNVTAA